MVVSGILTFWVKVTAKYAAASPAGARHSVCHQSERQFDVLISVSVIMPQTRLRPAQFDCGERHFAADQGQTDILSAWSHLAFLQFPLSEKGDLALLPYFCGSGRFDRIIEMGEQTGWTQENSKIFVKMVPLYPRFFSY